MQYMQQKQYLHICVLPATEKNNLKRDVISNQNSQAVDPMQNGQYEKVVKYRWRPRNGCGGRPVAKILITTIQVNLQRYIYIYIYSCINFIYDSFVCNFMQVITIQLVTGTIKSSYQHKGLVKSVEQDPWPPFHAETLALVYYKIKVTGQK